MHDIKHIRETPQDFDQGLKRRGLKALSETILSLDAKHRQITQEVQTQQARKNEIAAQMAQARKTGQNVDPLMAEGTSIKENLPDLEAQEADLKQKIHHFLITLPNLPNEEVPDGVDDTFNVEISKFSEPKTFSFEPKQHFQLGEDLGLMDFQQASQISGSRFVVLKGPLAQLERALAQFMLDIHTKEYGYCLVSPPLLVSEQTMFGIGQLPKFSEEAFRTTTNHWLIPTSEVPLTSLAAGKTLDAEVLPQRFTAHTPCFRSEAGAAGRDTRGMIRQHQFYKVELVSLTTPEDSAAEHERMRKAAEEVLRRLELPYRVMLLCAGDMGFAAQKTYDLEVWLPGQNAYREISSCSNCGDFQARRMNARYKIKGSTVKPRFVHTLNGSGLAVGRTLVAVLENYQQDDGTILVPQALVPYMNGIEVIKKTCL
ncbi:MAG: serine--tRNA ligase [Alphaproteobacteria bacterium]